MPPTIWNTYSNTSPSQKNISLSRLAIRTRGAVISRLIFPLTVLTTMGHLPATFTPHLLYLLKKGWLSATKIKTERNKELNLTLIQQQRNLRRGGQLLQVGGILAHQPSIQQANRQENNCRIQTIISTETSHVHLRTRQLDDTFRTQTTSDLPEN